MNEKWNEVELHDLGEEGDDVCEWCLRRIPIRDMPVHATIHTPNGVLGYQLCHACGMTAIHALQLGKEVTQECGAGNGRRVYFAIERVGEESELLSVKTWLGPRSEVGA